MSTRTQNGNKFGQWDELSEGGRCYRLDVLGKLGWRARYLKEVDANETTLRFWQEIYDDRGKLVETHEKYRAAMDVLRQLAMSSRGSFPGSGPSAAEKDRARSQIASLQGQIASLRGQLSGLQSRFNASRNDSEKRSLQQQIQSLQSRISSLSSQVSALRSRYRV